jgi:antitoxin YefM
VVVTTVPLGEVKDRLSEYITGVERTHDRVVITRHGRPAAVLVSPEDLAALEETVAILTTPGTTEAIAEGLADLEAGRVADNDALRARFAPR